MNTKQRQALEALRDVMREHDINIRFDPVQNSYQYRVIINKEWICSFESNLHKKVSSQTLNELLEQDND